MKSTVETLSETRVRLAIEVPFVELEPKVKRAYAALAHQIKVPGFRPGKVPTRLIDQRIGRQAVLEEAAQDAITEHYRAALREHDLKVLGQPTVDITTLKEGEPLEFTAEVDVRPEIALPELELLTVTVDEIAVTDEEIDEQVSGLRERFSTLKTVERAAAKDDFLLLDLSATVDGQPIPGGSAEAISYQVGTGRLVPGLDDVVVGMSAGEDASFQTTLANNEEGDVAVTVKTVRERELPPLDDDFAQLASEFDTLDELRADTSSRLEKVKQAEQAYQAQERALDALAEATEVPIPTGVVADEVAYRKSSMSEQLERIGETLENYLAAEEKTEEELDSELQRNAEQAVRIELVVDTFADAEELGVSDTELTTEVVRRAQASGRSAQEFADELTRSGRLGAMVTDVRRGKAVAAILERVKIVDSAGNPVDLAQLRAGSAMDGVDPLEDAGYLDSEEDLEKD